MFEDRMDDQLHLGAAPSQSHEPEAAVEEDPQ